MITDNTTTAVERTAIGKLKRSYSYVSPYDTVGSALAKLARTPKGTLKRCVYIGGPYGSGKADIINELGAMGALVQDGKYLRSLARIVAAESFTDWGRFRLDEIGKVHRGKLNFDTCATKEEVDIMQKWAINFDFFSSLPTGPRTGEIGEIQAYYIYCPYMQYKFNVFDLNIVDGLPKGRLLLERDRYEKLAHGSMGNYTLVMNYGRTPSDVVSAAQVILLLEKENQNTNIDFRRYNVALRKVLTVKVNETEVAF